MKRSFGTVIYLVSIILLSFMIFTNEDKIKKGTDNYEIINK